MRFWAIAAGLLCASLNARAQMVMQAHTLPEAVKQHSGSGTSVEPPSTSVPMLMTTRGQWQLMLHANAFVANTQQQAASERGRDAFFSTNWIMPMAQHPLGPGTFTARAMLSLEPATVTHRQYPELFQQGETAYGAPIVDGQHPHDFVMELAALYDIPFAQRGVVTLYAAPVGDPAIGPTAYPHRQSASEDPIAALGHHQEDSTHIAFNVLTGGLTYGWFSAELSGFHGGEPSEARWHFEPSPNGHAVDSIATRITAAPTPDLTAQYSIAHITQPEALYPHEDQQRQTASVMFHHAWLSRGKAPKPSKPMPTHASKQSWGDAAQADASKQPAPAHDSSMPGMDMSGDSMRDMPGMTMGPQPPAKTTQLAASTQTMPKHMRSMGAMSMADDPRNDLAVTLLWGRTKAEPQTPTPGSQVADSYLAEARLRLASRNYLWTRLENAARTNELALTPGQPLPQGFDESPIGHVAAFTFGYDRDFALGPHLLLAPGAQFTLYHSPTALRTIYGSTPTGEAIFLRLRLR